MADDGRRSGIRALLAMSGLTVAALLVVSIPSYAYSTYGLAVSPSPLEYVGGLVSVYGVLALLVVGSLRATGRDAPLDVRRPTRRDWAYAAGGSLASLLIVAVLFGVLSRTIGLPVAQPNLLAPVLEGRLGGGFGPERLLLAVPVFLLVVAPVEELLFRNVVQKTLSGAFSSSGAIAASSVLFSAFSAPTYYDPNAVATATVLAVVFPLSLLWGTLYHRTGSVVVPALAHGVPYAVLFGAYYLMVRSVGA